MWIIGVDYHPSVQQIAFVNTDTGECGERRLSHSGGEAEKFYRELKAARCEWGWRRPDMRAGSSGCWRNWGSSYGSEIPRGSRRSGCESPPAEDTRRECALPTPQSGEPCTHEVRRGSAWELPERLFLLNCGYRGTDLQTE